MREPSKNRRKKKFKTGGVRASHNKQSIFLWKINLLAQIILETVTNTLLNNDLVSSQTSLNDQL